MTNRMFKCRFRHQPEGFHFFLRDPTVPIPNGRAFVDEQIQSGFAVRDGVVSIRVLSEFSEIPIDVEVADERSPCGELHPWDHVVECPLAIRDGRVALQSVTDDDPFAEMSLPSGEYRVRVYWGGQTSRTVDGASRDYYLIQLWPAEPSEPAVVKGELIWPWPKQPWERR